MLRENVLMLYVWPWVADSQQALKSISLLLQLAYCFFLASSGCTAVRAYIYAWHQLILPSGYELKKVRFMYAY